MVNFFKRIIAFILIFTISIVSVSAISNDSKTSITDPSENFAYIDQLRLDSSRHTQSEEISTERMDDYLDNYRINYTLKELEFLGFEQVLENENFVLYLEKRSFSIILYNKENDFYWSSRPENQKISDGDNLKTRNLMNSGLIFEFARKDRLSTSRRESLLSVMDAFYRENDSLNNYFDYFSIAVRNYLDSDLSIDRLLREITRELDVLQQSILYYLVSEESIWNDNNTIYIGDVLKEHTITADLGVGMINKNLDEINIYFENLINSLEDLGLSALNELLENLLISFMDALDKNTEQGSIPDKLLPYAIDNSSLQTNRLKTKYTITNDRIVLDIDLKTIEGITGSLDIKFTIILTLTKTGLVVEIPSEAISEESEHYRLMNISVLPYFGSVRQDKVPGYFVIPDEIGALIRLDQSFSQSIPDLAFYNTDFAYNTTTTNALRLPIFGVVHEYNKDAFYVEIESGASNSILQTQLWTKNSEYQRIGVSYSVRQIYRTIINRLGEGTTTIPNNHTNVDFKASYHILNREDASYVGMAKNYRNILIDRGILSNREQVNDNKIPFHNGIILSDQEKSFIGTKTIKMTTIKELESIYKELVDEGITNQQITLYGWSKDGYLNKAPYTIKYVEREKDLKAFISKVKENNNTIYLENDYVKTSNSSNINNNRDTAQAISKVKIETKTINLNDKTTKYRYIKPEAALKLAIKDSKKIKKLGFDGISHESIGYTLFSEFQKGEIISRKEAIETYNTLTGIYETSQISKPNMYLWENLNGFIQMPIANSQYNQYSDTIPLLPLILKGSISYFGTYLNFNVLGKEHILQMIDYGINPSYIFTAEDTYKMRYTEAAKFYTTNYQGFKKDSIDNYHYINDALKYVVNAKIVDRIVLKSGFVVVSYDNNTDIYINYTKNNIAYNGISVPALDYKVVGI